MARLLVDVSVRDYELRAMRIRLSVTYKERFVRDIELHSPQSPVFGRKSVTGNADFQFDDERLSRRHFQIKPIGRVWIIEDVGSRHGTFVNDQRVDTIPLKQHDVIRAGKCEFTVQVYGIDSTEELTVVDDSDGGHTVAALARGGKWRLSVSVEKGDSGRTFVRGDFTQTQAVSELVRGLRQSQSLEQVWVMIDSHRLGTPLPAPLQEHATDIIDWLGPEFAAQASPRLVGLHDVPSEIWAPVLDETWGQDAVVILFGNLDREKTLAAVRKAARQGSAVAGIFWPSVLNYLLLHSQSAPGDHLLSCCQALLLEFADLPDQWMLIGHPDLPKTLQSLGMKCTVSAPATEVETEP